MDEFKIYDQAVIAFQKKLKTNKMPLLSWDFAGEFFSGLSNTMLDSRNLNVFASDNKWDAFFDFQSELEKDTVILITNPKIEIVYASQNMVKMNGYKPEEVLGRSPKIFQGEATNKSITKEISLAIKESRPFEATIINFHKDGSAYDCHIKGFPVFNKNRELLHFIAFERVA